MDVFISYEVDGDEAYLDRATLNDDVELLRRTNQVLMLGADLWRKFAQNVGGSTVLIGETKGKIIIGADHLDELMQLSQQYSELVGRHLSVGVGARLGESAKALEVAKLRGGNQILLWQDSMNKDLEAAEDLNKTAANEGAHAGFDGHVRPKRAQAEAPSTDAGEHSEAQDVYDTIAQASENQVPIEQTHAAADFEDQFHQVATEQSKKDEDDKAKADAGHEELRGEVVKVLQRVKQAVPVLAQIKQASPDTYQAVMFLVQSVVALGRELVGEESVQKSEVGEDPGAPKSRHEQQWELELELSKTEQPKIYRGLTQEEHDYIQKNGHILSDQRWCAPGEGTCFSHDFDTAEDTVNFGRTDPGKTGKPTYVIEVASGPEVKVDRDGWPKAQVPIPSSRITRAWRFKTRTAPEEGQWTKAGFAPMSKAEGDSVDSSRHLPEQHRATGYRLKIQDLGDGDFNATLHDSSGLKRGHLTYSIRGNELRPFDTKVDRLHRGFGTALYNAMTEHAKGLGATIVKVPTHSTLASGMLHRLSEVQGFPYEPKLDPDWGGVESKTGAHDYKYAPFEYSIGKAESTRLPALRPSSSTPSEDGYAYHVTNEDNAFSIAGQGLLTHKPWEGTDQDMWPDGATEKRSYHSGNAGHVWSFAPEEGRPVILRTKLTSHPFKKESTGDLYSRKPIAPHLLEIGLADGTWQPLQQWVGVQPIQKSMKELPDLGHAEIVEDGAHFKTGKPVRVKYIRHTAPAPKYIPGTVDTYQQTLEPHGRYLVHNPNPGDLASGIEAGEVQFRNPLVVAFNTQADKDGWWGAYNGTSWKARLSTALKAKGKGLSKKLLDMGHDGVVTIALKDGKPSHVSEIVDLTGFRKSESLAEEEDQLPGGNADTRLPRDFDPFELSLGIEHEMEHTDDPLIAREIAMDHLTENPSYYTQLQASGLEPDKKIEDDEYQRDPSSGKNLDKGAGAGPIAGAPSHHHLHLPPGSQVDGKIKVTHAEGGESWKSMRAGQISAQDPSPLFGANTHPTSSREPGAK